MRRFVAVIGTLLLAAASCSSGDDSDTSAGPGGSDTPVVAEDDPTAAFCTRWDVFAALMDSDTDPSNELVAEVLEGQRGIEEVLPDELSTAWADITSWNMAFIEFFGAAGYQEITNEVMATAFGDQQAADEASAAVEAGFRAMHDWSNRNCAGGEGDASAFCTAWSDLAPILVQLDEEAPTEDLVDELFAAYDEAGPDVPAEIRDDWDALLAFAVPFRDVLVTVEYDLDRVADELLVQAFGSLEEVERLEEASDAAVAKIGDWSLEGCGGFCARWGETTEAIDQTGQYLGWVLDWGDEGPRQFDAMRSRIDLAAALVPDELASDWNQLETMLDYWIAWWEDSDFDARRLESPESSAAARELAERFPSFEDLVIEQWAVPVGDRESFLADMWSNDASHISGIVHDVIPQGIASARDRLATWVEANCGVAGGRPGRLRVTWPAIDDAAGSTIVLAVMPPGATMEQLGDLDAHQAGYCESVSRDPWGYELDPDGNRNPWGTDWFRSERGQWEADWLCGFSWEEGPATLEAGPHTLLAALVPGGVQGPTLPALPTACLAVDFDIDGDTELQLGPLHPCEADLSELVLEPDPWRTTDPVDPSMPGAGTLRVSVPSLVLPADIEGEHGGELTIVVLPAGTTLNDVGREEVWPEGGFRTHMEPRQGQPHIEELERLGAVAVPIMAMPPTGEFGHLEPWWLHEASPDQLPLTLLAPGDYDVHVQVSGHGDELEDKRCGRTRVTIDGDTVIEMPELGECP